MSQNHRNIYIREKLYEEVWNQPVIKVAESYGVSNVAIKKICKSMNIPTPPNGYWTKLKFGKEVKKPPLPPAKTNQNIRYGGDFNYQKLKEDSPLSFLDTEQQERIFTVAQSLKIIEKTTLCKEIEEHKDLVNKWNSKNFSIEGLSCSYSEYKHRHSVYNRDREKYDRPPVLAGVISENELLRAYKILDALMEGIKQLGYLVNDDMSFQIRDERVTFYIYEKQESFDHVITPEEAEKLRRYEKDVKRNPWAIKPSIRSHDYLFNGKLLFNTKKVTYIQDTDKIKLEDRISDMLIQLIQQSEIVRNERLDLEDKKRREKEEWRQRNLPEITFNEEVDQLTTLLQEAHDFERAEKIRNYVAGVQQNDTNHEKTDWIQWANDKADWYDPTIDKSDNLFGKRNHAAEAIPEKKYVSYW